MTDNSGIDKPYVARYLKQAESTDNEDLKNNALYRVGTQMEIIESTGDMNLTPEQQQTIVDAAKELLKDG